MPPPKKTTPKTRVMFYASASKRGSKTEVFVHRVEVKKYGDRYRRVIGSEEEAVVARRGTRRTSNFIPHSFDEDRLGNTIEQSIRIAIVKKTTEARRRMADVRELHREAAVAGDLLRSLKAKADRKAARAKALY